MLSGGVTERLAFFVVGLPPAHAHGFANLRAGWPAERWSAAERVAAGGLGAACWPRPQAGKSKPDRVLLISAAHGSSRGSNNTRVTQRHAWVHDEPNSQAGQPITSPKGRARGRKPDLADVAFGIHRSAPPAHGTCVRDVARLRSGSIPARLRPRPGRTGGDGRARTRLREPDARALPRRSLRPRRQSEVRARCRQVAGAVRT
jgi:hypothetical protein